MHVTMRAQPRRSDSRASHFSVDEGALAEVVVLWTRSGRTSSSTIRKTGRDVGDASE